MMDIDQFFGEDIADMAAGDLPAVGGDDATHRTIIRRLVTNPGDYIWHPEYGAGIRKYVGANASTLREMEGTIASHVALEEQVAKYPVPTVTMQMVDEVLACTVTYADTTSNQLKTFSFNTQE